MKVFTIVAPPPPVEADRKLEKLYSGLAADMATVAQQRAALFAEYNAKAAQHRALKVEQPTTVGLTAAQIAADLAALSVKQLELEIRALEPEIDIVDRLLHYLPRARESRQRAVSVAAEMIALAEQRVREEFERAWPRKTWPINDKALVEFVARHPVVLGARQRLTETQDNFEQDATNNAERTASAMRARLALLQHTLDAQRRTAAQAALALKEIAATSAAQEAERREAEAQRLAEHKAIVEEAKKRLALAQ